MTRKQLVIMMSFIYCFLATVPLIGWNPFSENSWKEVGRGIEDVGKKVEEKVVDPVVSTVISPAAKWTGQALLDVASFTGDCFKNPSACPGAVLDQIRTLANMIRDKLDIAAKIGKQMIVGAEKLKLAPGLLAAGKKELEKTLLGGIEEQLIPKLKQNMANIIEKRKLIDSYLALIRNKWIVLQGLGLTSLASDLNEGLKSSMQALNLLYDDTTSPTTGYLYELFKVADETVVSTKSMANELAVMSKDLQRKIDNPGFCMTNSSLRCNLPGRLEALGKTLEALPKVIPKF